jgi:hypothetical protein
VNGVEVQPVAFLNAVIQRNIARNADRIPAQDSYEIHLAIGNGRARRQVEPGQPGRARRAASRLNIGEHNGLHPVCMSQAEKVGP